ncbi:MAG: hypothetical protein H7Y36_12620, partial [Armatimonadetes bacterium]|nr:hypothetical protein [Akkermansiaceae bacterium]
MLFTPPILALEAVRKPAPAAFARVSGLGLLSYTGMAGSGRHAISPTDVRTAPGWLSVRRPLTFMAERAKFLGTELHVL